MKLTTKEYAALRVFLLKVINRSDTSLEEAEVKAGREVLRKLVSFDLTDL